VTAWNSTDTPFPARALPFINVYHKLLSKCWGVANFKQLISCPPNYNQKIQIFCNDRGPTEKEKKKGSKCQCTLV